MKEKLLHTPEGVRDIYNSECKKKTALERKLHQVLALYGYQDIETPAFEFFDIFNSDTGTVSSREMFKFFDRDNNTLVLRPDMTPSIARSVAKYYSDCDFPLRLSYVGNTFLNNRSYQGKLAEKTELGAEYINDDSPEADAEAIVMMIDCFLAAGLSDFRIDIGQSEFYRAIMEALDVSDEVKAQIHEYIENKNSLGMELLLSDIPMKDCYRNILLEYNELYGDASMLEQAKKLTINPRCQAAIERLEQVYEVICHYGYEKYVTLITIPVSFSGDIPTGPETPSERAAGMTICSCSSEKMRRPSDLPFWWTICCPRWTGRISRCPSVSLSIPYSFIIEKICRKRFIWRWICEAAGTRWNASAWKQRTGPENTFPLRKVRARTRSSFWTATG